MNIFCRLLGHTWEPASASPRIRWSADKNGLQLVPTVEGTPDFFEVCVRCRQRRDAPPPRAPAAPAQ